MMSEEKRKEKRHKTKIKISSLLIVLSCICFILASYHFLNPAPTRAYQIICKSNLDSLGRAMITYAADNEGILPTPSKWCDLLIEGGYANKRKFKCPRADSGPCNYAMNRNLENIGRLDTTNIHPDIVLLFETGPGWNQVGGPEILTTTYHWDRGCNVLFMDYGVSFVMKQHLHKLKWKPDEAQQE